MTNTVHRTPGSRSIQDAVFGCNGKPDAAGGPLSGPTFLWKPVVAGGLIGCLREARQSGRPGDNHTRCYMEAGLCRRPYYIQMGSLTLHGSRPRNPGWRRYSSRWWHWHRQMEWTGPGNVWLVESHGLVGMRRRREKSKKAV